MNFSELMEFNKDFFGDETWIIEVFIIVLLTGFINFIQKRSHHKILSKLKKTKTFWDDTSVILDPFGGIVKVLSHASLS